MQISQVDGKVWRGEHPTAPADFQRLKSLGISKILNLEWGWDEFFRGRINSEVDMAIEAGFEVTHIQLGDLRPPREEDLRAALIEIMAARGPIYVHCLHGVDRTGMEIALYRVKVQGWSPESAIEDMYKMGFHRIYQFLGWVSVLKKAMGIK